MSNCWNRISLELASDGVPSPEAAHEGLVIMIGLITMIILGILASMLAYRAMYLHLQHYYQPEIQRYIVRIFGLIPVITITTMLSYRFNTWTAGLEVIRSIAISIGIVDLLKFMMNILGSEGEEELREIFRHRKPTSMLFPFQFIQYRPSNKFHLPIVRLATHQAAIMLPILSIIGFLIQVISCTHQSITPQLFLHLSRGLFSIVAIYALSNFYYLSRLDFQEDVGLMKFTALLTLIFLPIFLSALIDVLVQTGAINDGFILTKAAIATRIDGFVTTLVLFIIAIILFIVLNHNRFQLWEAKETKVWPSFKDTGNLTEIPKEIWFGFISLIYPNLINRTRSSLVNTRSYVTSIGGTIKHYESDEKTNRCFNKKINATPLALFPIPPAAHLKDLRHRSVQQIDLQFNNALKKLETKNPTLKDALNFDEDRRNNLDFAPHSRPGPASNDTLRNLSSMSSINFTLPPSQLRRYIPSEDTSVNFSNDYIKDQRISNLNSSTLDDPISPIH